MGVKMTTQEKHERREARVVGGWAASAMRAVRLLQLRADGWQAEYPGYRAESARVYLAQADERQAQAVEYARRAAHHARAAIAIHEEQRQLRASEEPS